MNSNVKGADLDALELLATEIERKAGSLGSVTQAATDGVLALDRLWDGPDSDQYRQVWLRTHRPRLNLAVQELEAAATTIRRNRRAQELTSTAVTGAATAAVGLRTVDLRPVGAQTHAGQTTDADLPPFPPPPPPPPDGDGSAEHGSKGRNWFQDRWDDGQRAFWFEVADGADTLGLDNAARHMRHYLGNSGDDLAVDPAEMVDDLPGFGEAVEQTIEFDLQIMISDRIDAEYTGEPLTFQVTTDWESYYAEPSESQDWFYGLGGFAYAVGADVTVVPGPDGRPVVEVSHQTHVFDRYNWDDGKSVDIGPFNVSDESLGHLHEVGRAQEFEVRGTSDPDSFTYDYEPDLPGGPPAGPPEPEPVDVNGTDDGRDRTDDPTRNDDRSRRSGDRESDPYR